MTMSTKRNITIVNLKDPSNATLVEKIRVKLGNVVDNITIFAFQNGVEPISYKYHEKQKKLFVMYPSFNLITTNTVVQLYLKRDGETFPSKCYKIKKSDVKDKLISQEINDYINEEFDPIPYLESVLTNETIVVFDNLKVGVLIKTIEKEKEKSDGMDGQTTYARMFDLIGSKMNEVLDSGYLDLLNKTCVMMWQTWNDPTSLNFEPCKIDKKKEKASTPKTDVKRVAPKVEKTEELEKEKAIPTFVNPDVTPPLENLNEAKEPESVEVDQEAVNKVIEEI